MGNMTRNSRDGLEFSYNLANLPESVEGADGASLTYRYMPFGTRIPGSIQAADNRHRFGGKEEQRYGIDAATGSPAIDLGLLDFGARYYDPFTCRWTTIDPMAGKYYNISPFSYCAGNPINVTDSSGAVLETAWDVASLAMGVKSFVSNVKQGKVGAAIVDGIGIALDAVAVVAPCVPGGVSAGLKAARGADKVADAVKALNKADDMVDAAHIANMQRGVANEGRTLKALGETKNTKSFTTILNDGSIKTTIPDINNGTTIGEIKDTKSIFNTKQIQAERKVADDSGKEFKIYTGTNTHVSRIIPESEIVRLPWLGPQ